MAGDKFNLHSKELIDPVDSARFFQEVEDETGKVITKSTTVLKFRNWLMGTALFSTLNTVGKNIIEAINELKEGIDNNTKSIEDNTTQLNAMVNNKADSINQSITLLNGFTQIGTDPLILNKTGKQIVLQLSITTSTKIAINTRILNLPDGFFGTNTGATIYYGKFLGSDGNTYTLSVNKLGYVLTQSIIPANVKIWASIVFVIV